MSRWPKKQSCATWVLVVAVSAGIASGSALGVDPEFHAARKAVTEQPATFDNEIYFMRVGGQVVRSDRFAGSSDLFGDFDGDGDVDILDYRVALICHTFSGPDIPTPPACDVFDDDQDVDVDFADMAVFLIAYTGSLNVVHVEAGGLVPVIWPLGPYYSGEPGTPGNNALNGNAAQAGYTQEDLWYEWTVLSQPVGSGAVVISNASLPASAYTILPPVALGSYVFELTVTNLITLESGSDTVILDMVECLEDEECDDSNVCTDDACSSGSCLHAPTSAPCDDGDACTAEDVCGAAVCAGLPIDCDDADPCTTDECVLGECVNVPSECADYVVWYTSNVCCWGAPHITITDRAGFEAPGLRSDWPGGGIDPVDPVTKAELQGGFASVDDAKAWLCPQFTSWTFHFWCGSHIQGPLGGNWQGTAGCSFDPPLPQAEVAPEFNGCP